jgi:hypothetical protein
MGFFSAPKIKQKPARQENSFEQKVEQQQPTEQNNSFEQENRIEQPEERSVFADNSNTTIKKETGEVW